MSDSEDDDWFTKDLDEFVAPQVVSSRKGEAFPEGSNEISIKIHPNQATIPGDTGGVYAPSKHAKRKSNIPNNQKFLSQKLKNLLQKPGHYTTLDLFVHLDRWQNTLQDFCDVLDRDGLDQCLEILDRVMQTPLAHLKMEIFLATCKIPLFFSWYLKKGLSPDNGKWKYRAMVNRMMKEIRKLIEEQKDKVDWRFLDELKIYPSIADSLAERPPPQSILPTLRDLIASPPELQSLPISGPIEDSNNYLTIQMDLLREELLHDLRDQIQEIRSNNGRGGQLNCFSGVRLTRNEAFEVFIQDPAVTLKILHGSLLLLSTTNQFSDLILATINGDLNSSTRELRIELIAVENIQKDIFSVPLFMTSCPAFFEPIYRVHQQLRSLHDEHQEIPFRDIILQLDKRKQKEKVHKKKLNPITTGLYPQQVAAVTHALEQRVTLIEGPPGTGKSLVGQKIIENLLKCTKGARILVISVTNHALDDVLKGLLPTTKNIIRFGTQSKERELDEYNVKNLECTDLPSLNLIREAVNSAKTRYLTKLTHNDLQKLISTRQKYLKIIQEIRHIETASKVQSKSVLGMTTAAAARLHILLELYQPQVLIAEEAAEILECHTLSALTKSLEQMILIGDHHQLRATLQVPHLGFKYNFDVSLFERLVGNGLEPVILNLQSRMRPELSDLMRGIFYNQYEDNRTVHKLPERIRGVQRNLYFMDHEQQEVQSLLSKSKGNLFEAKFSLELVGYLLKQGYKAENIVILSFYNGHLEMISSMVRGVGGGNDYRHLGSVRVRTVDNFQGEEAEIVILNAVRSNEEQSIGHVRVKNRICTAMSRAKCGLFIVGNSKMLREGSRIWRELIERLERKEAIGRKFPLKCERHGNRMEVGDAKGFTEAVNSSGGCPEELCGVKCDNCTETCLKECHAGERHDCKC